MDWVIESSPAAQNAFAEAIGSSYFAANDFARLNSYPIRPVSELPGDFAYAHYLPAILGDKKHL